MALSYTKPAARDRIVERLDPQVTWPMDVADALSKLALSCVSETARRPTFKEIAADLRQIVSSSAQQPPCPEQEDWTLANYIDARGRIQPQESNQEWQSSTAPCRMPPQPATLRPGTVTPGASNNNNIFLDDLCGTFSSHNNSSVAYTADMDSYHSIDEPPSFHTIVPATHRGPLASIFAAACSTAANLHNQLAGSALSTVASVSDDKFSTIPPEGCRIETP